MGSVPVKVEYIAGWPGETLVDIAILYENVAFVHDTPEEAKAGMPEAPLIWLVVNGKPMWPLEIN